MQKLIPAAGRTIARGQLGGSVFPYAGPPLFNEENMT